MLSVHPSEVCVVVTLSASNGNVTFASNGEDRRPGSTFSLLLVAEPEAQEQPCGGFKKHLWASIEKLSLQGSGLWLIPPCSAGVEGSIGGNPGERSHWLPIAFPYAQGVAARESVNPLSATSACGQGWL